MPCKKHVGEGLTGQRANHKAAEFSFVWCCSQAAVDSCKQRALNRSTVASAQQSNTCSYSWPCQTHLAHTNPLSAKSSKTMSHPNSPSPGRAQRSSGVARSRASRLRQVGPVAPAAHGLYGSGDGGRPLTVPAKALCARRAWGARHGQEPQA